MPECKVDLPIKKCDSVTVHLYYGTLAVKDNTNTVESVLDLLVDMGVLEDDNWQKVIAWMIDNKDLGMPGIIKVLSQKYKINPVVVDELSKFIKS